MSTREEAVSSHLWEHNHPYYCAEGCYYTRGTEWAEVHAYWDSWADFFEDWGNVDPDLNLLFRWDWNRSDPADYSVEIKEDPEFEMPGDTLSLYFFLQRKAKPFSHTIKVKEADEPAVRRWLTARAEHMRVLWEPLLEETAALSDVKEPGMSNQTTNPNRRDSDA